MKKVIIFIGALLFLGCASKTSAPKLINTTNDIKKIEEFVKGVKIDSTKIARYTNNVENVKEVKKILLKNNPVFAKKHKKEALKEKVRLPLNAPLYIPPRFAEMTIFPYVSDDGIYHDLQIVWVKIKDGEFVLGNQKVKNQRVYTINGGYR